MSAMTRRITTLKSVMKEYAGVTEFHGFAILADASVPIMVTWGLLIAFAFGFAARDFAQLVSFYQSEPTTLSVSVESNVNFVIPNPTICMETTVPYLSKDREFLTQTNYYTTNGISMDIQRLLLSTDNVNKNYEKMDMSYRLFYYTYALLAYWTDAEMRLVGQQQDYHRKLFSDWSIQDPNLSDSIQVVYDIYKSRNVSLANLKRLMARQMCYEVIMSALKYNKLAESFVTDPVPYDFCNPELITHLSFSLLCFKAFIGQSVQLNESNAMSISYGPIVPFDNYGVREYYDWMNVMTQSGTKYDDLVSSVDNAIVPPPSTKSMDDPDNTWVNYRFYLDLKGRATLPEMSDDSVISWNPLQNTFISVSVASEFQFYNAKSHPCATETQYDCEWRQRISQIRQKCGCWPSSLIFAVNSSLHPRCEVNLSAAYRGRIAVGRCQANSNLTIQPCISECQLISYDKGQLESTFWDIPLFRFPRYKSLPNGLFQLTLETSDQRLVISESIYKDWTTFTAELGGSIGTWLGASLLTFVHLPYFFIQKLLQRLSDRKKTAETTE